MEEEVFEVETSYTYEARHKTTKPQKRTRCIIPHGKETWEDPKADEKAKFKTSEKWNAHVIPCP